MALVQIQETPRWKKLLGYVGPGILVSASYLDPGNLETDLQAGADHKHELLWIVLVGLTFAFIIQCCAARLGYFTVVDGIEEISEARKHLAEHCKEEYPSPVKYCLWILAEVAVIAADIPAVLGTAFALNILFRIPMWSGVLLAGLNTLLLLGMQRYGIRKLEIVIGMLIMTMGGCCFAVMLKARPSAEEIVTGMFVPKLNGKKATTDGIALLGALVMPHNLFLHSALVISRKFPHSFNGISSATKYFFIESGLSLFLAFLINVAVISVSASVCSNPNTTSESKAHCRNITLESAAFLFKNALGKWSAKLYAISVLASGQSSTVSGTFAGQYIMQGFLDLKMELWLRNLITRCIAIGPSLVVCIVGGPHEAARLIIIVSMILAFELPFVLVPLLRFTSSETKMGQHKNPILVSLVSWLLGFCSIGINMYFLSSALIGRLTSKQMTKTESILTGVIALLIMVFYISLFTYMTLKRENSADSSHNLGTSTISTGGTGNEKGLDSSSNQRTDEIEMDDIINA